MTEDEKRRIKHVINVLCALILDPRAHEGLRLILANLTRDLSELLEDDE